MTQRQEKVSKVFICIQLSDFFLPRAFWVCPGCPECKVHAPTRRCCCALLLQASSEKHSFQLHLVRSYALHLLTLHFLTRERRKATMEAIECLRLELNVLSPLPLLVELAAVAPAVSEREHPRPKHAHPQAR